MWVQWILPEELAICGFPVNRKDMRDLRVLREVLGLVSSIRAQWQTILTCQVGLIHIRERQVMLTLRRQQVICGFGEKMELGGT